MNHIFRTMLAALAVLCILSIAACAPATGKALTKESHKEQWDDDYDKFDDQGSGGDEYAGDNDRKERKNIRRREERTVRSARQVKSERSGADARTRDDSMDTDSDASGGERESFYQTGKASWYGREFNGRRTASGERFNMKEMTAAHKTLPFGTRVLVKNLDNGKSVTVRINDRGPYREGRILDLSHAAARRIDMLKSGEAMIGITVLKKGADDRSSGRSARGDNEVEPVAGDNRDRYAEKEADDERGRDDYKGKKERDSGTFSIQAGAFYSKKNAVKLRKKLESMFNNPVVVIRDVDLYKVRIENIKSKGDARNYKRRLKDEDISSFVMQGEE